MKCEPGPRSRNSLCPQAGVGYLHRSLFVKMPNVAQSGPLWDYLQERLTLVLRNSPFFFDPHSAARSCSLRATFWISQTAPLMRLIVGSDFHPKARRLNRARNCHWNVGGRDSKLPFRHLPENGAFFRSATETRPARRGLACPRLESRAATARPPSGRGSFLGRKRSLFCRFSPARRQSPGVFE